MVGQHIGSAKNTELSGEIVTPPFIASTEEARDSADRAEKCAKRCEGVYERIMSK